MKVYVVELSMHYESHVDSVWTTSELAEERVKTLKSQCSKEDLNGCEIIELGLNNENV